MKNKYFLIALITACLSLSSFTAEKCFGDNGSMGGDYIYYTDVVCWTSATESDTYSIYYKEGNGERKYAIYIGYYYYDIHDNHYYNSAVCEDFRKYYQYVSNDYYYFNCTLPGRGEEIVDGYRFHTQVKGWENAFDSNIYSVFYKEGNGERVYSIHIGYYYYDIHDNDYYNSPVCNDFRKNYRYVSQGYYFNCDLPGREREVVDGYYFYAQVLGWTNATDSDIFSIYYKEGNGRKVYYLHSGYYYYEVEKNEYYNIPSCDDFRRYYKYTANGRYFDKPMRR